MAHVHNYVCIHPMFCLSQMAATGSSISEMYLPRPAVTRTCMPWQIGGSLEYLWLTVYTTFHKLIRLMIYDTNCFKLVVYARLYTVV